MGRAQRSKGARIEREIVNRLREDGIPAERVPLSGAAGGSFTGDIRVADQWRAEVKGRGDGGGFTLITRWLGANDILFLREDRCQPLVLIPYALFRDLVRGQRDFSPLGEELE